MRVHLVGSPRLICHGAALPATGAPSEEVYPVVVGLRNILVVLADKVVLVLGEAPHIQCRVVAQVAAREAHLLAGSHRIEGIRCTGSVEAANQPFLAFLTISAILMLASAKAHREHSYGGNECYKCSFHNVTR